MSNWDTKATIHIPLKEKDLYYLDLLAEDENKRRYEIIEIYQHIRKYKKNIVYLICNKKFN